MKFLFAIAAFTASVVVASQAQAQNHDVGNAALGTAAGLVIFGPVGAVAGAAVGYTAGEGIARSWGISRPRKKVRKARKPKD
jgi:hypothetical protein